MKSFSSFSSSDQTTILNMLSLANAEKIQTNDPRVTELPEDVREFVVGEIESTGWL